jgi:uncharacterized Zn-finger protein
MADSINKTSVAFLLTTDEEVVRLEESNQVHQYRRQSAFQTGTPQRDWKTMRKTPYNHWNGKERIGSDTNGQHNYRFHQSFIQKRQSDPTKAPNRIPLHDAASSSVVNNSFQWNCSESPYKCDICSYSSVSMWNLKIHRARHTGEKPYKCQYCNYSTIQSSNLTMHYYIHTGYKRFKCSYENCNYSCISSSDLKKHTYIHTGDKPYKCDYENCGYSCTTSSTLKTHKFVHTGEKPFKCDYPGCNYACNRSTNLNRHKKMHIR